MGFLLVQCALLVWVRGSWPAGAKDVAYMHSGGKYVVIIVFRSAVCQLFPSRYLLDLCSSCSVGGCDALFNMCICECMHALDEVVYMVCVCTTFYGLGHLPS